MGNTEKILVGRNNSDPSTIQLLNALNKLNEAFTEARLSEFEISYRDESLHDFISGKRELACQFRNRLENDINNDTSLPAIKRQKDKIYQGLMEELNKLIAEIKKATEEIRYIPAELFYIDYNKSKILAKKEAYDFAESRADIYIDKPEQKEMYHLAKKVLDDIEKIEKIAQKYAMSAFGSRGVFDNYTDTGALFISIGALVECLPDGVWARAKG